MGSLATIGQQNLPNYKHIVINNGAHDSVGAQPTDARNLDTFSIPNIAKACGYREVSVTSRNHSREKHTTRASAVTFGNH